MIITHLKHILLKKWISVCLAIAAMALLSSNAYALIYIICEKGSGKVMFSDSVDKSLHLVMDGPFPGERTAMVWIEENCPDRQCNASGACGEPAATTQTKDAWLVVCDPESGAAGVVRSPLPAGFVLLAGKDGSAQHHIDRNEAQTWTEENCPSWLCDKQGLCAGGGVISKPVKSTNSWSAGDVTSETISSSPSGNKSLQAPDPQPDVAGPLSGPSSTDLSPLMNSTKAAAQGCNYSAALASIEQMANFDPENPWYITNRQKLKQLARRQKETEQLIWQASSMLSAGDLQGANELARAAADTSVSCQNQGIVALLDGIDTAIKQQRLAKNQANRKAYAALLPQLVDLSRALSGDSGGASPNTSAMNESSLAVFGYKHPTSPADACTFKYTYRTKWDTEPMCTCSGYRFDARQFRCVQ